MTIFVFIDPLLSLQDIKTSQLTLVEEKISGEKRSLQVSSTMFQDLLPFVKQGQEVWLVCSVKLASLHVLQLPKLNRKDLMPAIRSLIEDRMLQDFASYHCFYQSTTTVTGMDLLLGLIDKTYIEELTILFEAEGLQISGIALDWFALNDNEVLLLGSEEAISRVPDFMGWIPKSLLKAKLTSKLALNHLISFQKLEYAPINTEILDDVLYNWVVKRFREKGIFDILMPKKPFYFLEKLPKAKAEKYTKIGILGLFVASTLVFLGLFSANIYQSAQNNKIMSGYSAVPSEELAQKLAIYEAQQTQKNKFWKIYVGLQQAYNSKIKILSLNYEQGTIRLTINASDMSDYQSFKQSLASQRLQAQESQVVVNGTAVQANLDLRSS